MKFKKPKAGLVWNPMLRYPRNESCYCGSGVKFKKCCISKQDVAVKKEVAAEAAAHVHTIRDARNK